MSEAAPGDRLYPSRPILAASVATFRGGRVLVARRPRPPSAGLYSLPGGAVEAGETLRAAALRELAEEVGIEADIVGFVDHVEPIRFDNGRLREHYVIAVFAARWRAGEARPGPEADAVLWVEPEKVAQLPTTPGLPAIVAAAARLERSRP
jgi:ADP-ribose pyrophosphatase YjhB (NUDIX family)